MPAQARCLQCDLLWDTVAAMPAPNCSQQRELIAAVPPCACSFEPAVLLTARASGAHITSSAFGNNLQCINAGPTCLAVRPLRGVPGVELLLQQLKLRPPRRPTLATSILPIHSRRFQQRRMLISTLPACTCSLLCGLPDVSARQATAPGKRVQKGEEKKQVQHRSQGMS
jgi:hypothetical protein